MAQFRRRHDDGRVFKVRHQGAWDRNYEPVKHEGHSHPQGQLSAAQRNNLSPSDFAIPEERKYPIYDKSHAQNALSRVSANGTPEEKRRVRMAVCKRYGHTFENSSTCPMHHSPMNDGKSA